MQALPGTSQVGLKRCDNQQDAVCAMDLAADAELPATPGAADNGSQTCLHPPCPGSYQCFAEAPEMVSPKPQVPSHTAAQFLDLQAQLSELTCRQDRQVAVFGPQGWICLSYDEDAFCESLG